MNAKKSPRRVRDPQSARTAVLDAALELFAEHGFADTSLRDISRRSGVSHPLILHHFGSKDELYREVKRRVVEGYAQRFPAAATNLDRKINFRTELKRIMTYIGENELALKLCARTRIDGDYQVWPGEPNLLDLLSQRLESAQRQGWVRGDLRSRELSVMLLGIVFFWLDNREHFHHRFGSTITDDSYLRTAIRMINEGVLPRNLSEEKRLAVSGTKSGVVRSTKKEMPTRTGTTADETEKTMPGRVARKKR